jgi:hypothetical protein
MSDSTLGLTEVVWVGPENRKVYVGSPSVWRTANGSCLASHDYFGVTTISNTVQVFADHSGGPCEGLTSKWTYVGNVSGMYWANIFQQPHGGGFFTGESIYLLGVDSGDHAISRSITITRSDDYGVTWTKPSKLFASSSPNCSYHTAPTPTLVADDGRLYRAFEVTTGAGGLHSVMIRTTAPVHVNRHANQAVTPLIDLLSPGSWEISTPAPFPPKPIDWDPAGHFSWEEGNAVQTPEGGLVIILRIDGQTNVTYNKAAIVTIVPDQNQSRLASTSTSTSTSASTATFGTAVFDRMIDFPSTTSKFVIRRQPPAARVLIAPATDAAGAAVREPASTDTTGAKQRSAERLYYSLVNDVTTGAAQRDLVYARNHLSLAVSADMYNWTVCATLLTDDTGFDPVDSARFTGFHYVDWVFDEYSNNSDILYSIRAGYRGSNTFHNANRLLVKRLPNYAAVCAAGLNWAHHFKAVGKGWCRPTTGYMPSGKGLDDRDCAQRCIAAGDRCGGFANDPTSDCVLYPQHPTKAAGGSYAFECFAKNAAETTP